eukprot:1383047-Amorphochlora_amoeboformis.AAC.1
MAPASRVVALVMAASLGLLAHLSDINYVRLKAPVQYARNGRVSARRASCIARARPEKVFTAITEGTGGAKWRWPWRWRGGFQSDWEGYIGL